MGAFLYKWAPVIARLLILPIFVYSAYRKFAFPSATAAQIASTYVMNLGGDPGVAAWGGWRVLGYMAGSVELFGAAMLLIGWKTKLGGLLLVAYVVPVTVLFHGLGWLNAEDAQVAHREALALFKNLGIVAALLLTATYGPGRPSVDVRD
jgi:uncharacterized membrane protein YphA (DoxX/SURF4 family)